MVFQPLGLVFLGLFPYLLVELEFEFLVFCGSGLVPLCDENPCGLCDPGLLGVFGFCGDGGVGNLCGCAGYGLPLSIYFFLRLWNCCGGGEVVGQLLVEVLLLCQGGLSWELWWSSCGWQRSSLDSDGGLYEVVVGGQSCCVVGGDIQNRSSPGLWCNDVVQLDLVSIGSSVGVYLLWSLFIVNP